MADKKRCVVTGLGLICGVGDNVKDCWDAVTLGHSGIEADNIDFVCCDDRKIIKTLMPCYDVSQEIGNARAAASAMTAAYAAELLSDSEKNYEYGLALSMGAGGTYSAVILKKV